jgi:hypothetical protein
MGSPKRRDGLSLWTTRDGKSHLFLGRTIYADVLVYSTSIHLKLLGYVSASTLDLLLFH